jgi:hypothetical protein
VFPVRYELDLYILICAPYGSHIKQRLLPQTAITGQSLLCRRSVFSVK